MASVTILDGGFSTQLRLVTGDVVDGDPLWTARYLATNPGAVLRAHLDFLNAGAEVIITDSYQASLEGFAKYLGMDECSGYDLMRESVRIARRAAEMYTERNPGGGKPKIAGSVGPYGASLHDGSEYTGAYVDDVSADVVSRWHRPRISALIDEGVDFLALETIPALSEAESLLRILKEYPRQKFWLSFQCKDDVHLAHGEKFGDAARKCWQTSKDQLVAVGCNCLNPRYVRRLLKSVNADDGKERIPLIVYPNSGEEYSAATGWSGKAEDVDFAGTITSWLDSGVAFIGGCCRTDANYVANVRDIARKWSAARERAPVTLSND